MLLYHLNVTVHLLAALFWLGGMFFFGLVGAPVLRAIDSPTLRRDLFRELGERFRTFAWWAIGVLLVTGVLNLHFRGVLRAELLFSSEFWSGAFGRALAWKLSAVVVMVAASAIHDFVHGPRSGRLDPRSEEAARARRSAALFARANAFVGIFLVYWSVRLGRGG